MSMLSWRQLIYYHATLHTGTEYQGYCDKSRNIFINWLCTLIPFYGHAGLCYMTGDAQPNGRAISPVNSIMT